MPSECSSHVTPADLNPTTEPLRLYWQYIYRSEMTSEYESGGAGPGVSAVARTSAESTWSHGAAAGSAFYMRGPPPPFLMPQSSLTKITHQKSSASGTNKPRCLIRTGKNVWSQFEEGIISRQGHPQSCQLCFLSAYFYIHSLFVSLLVDCAERSLGWKASHVF